LYKGGVGEAANEPDRAAKSIARELGLRNLVFLLDLLVGRLDVVHHRALHSELEAVDDCEEEADDRERD
jgi:hypothetical protein